MVTIEHYKVPCQECGIACMDYLCLQATDNGEPAGTYHGIKGFTSYRWGTRFIMNVIISTPGPDCMDCGGPTAELDEVLDTTVQPAGTRFELGLAARYLAAGTESDLRLVEPDCGGTERHLMCADAAACEPLHEVMESTELNAAVTPTFEHPSDPSQPLIVVNP
ncbi:MAG: hypothetical protein DRI90_19910 [Deltaproteobacteria bacterium]|nr:MAG: hypothetical protein DRI90_19910 [Deltaproteobacteria bacterium]